MLNDIRKHLLRAAQLRGIGALLSWDQETGMPTGAIDARAEQTALISELEHHVWISPEFESALATVIDLKTGTLSTSDISEHESTAVHLIYKDWVRAKALPTKFVSQYAEASSKCQHAWAAARKANCFDEFAPHLQSIIALTQEKASYFPHFSCPYDALLDEYEPGMTVSQLLPLFEALKIQTLSLLTDLKAIPQKSPPPLTGHFPIAAQRELSLLILRDIGFDFNRGRLDPSVHPFSTDIHPNDVRITTRYDESDLMENLSSTLHEAGHGLYEQGLDIQWYGTPLCQSLSLGIHESQSRFWENIVGKSPSFLSAYLREIQNRFPEPFSKLSANEIYQSINQVTPSLIRVQADELTYNLHILIRFEIEQLLFNQQALVTDLPKIWNQKYSDYLGVTPPDFASGILQDVHWSAGLFGYFPTYTLGNLFCAQFTQTMKSDIPQFDSLIESRNFAPILGWLRHHIHQKGRLVSAPELIQSVSGKPLGVDDFIQYARKKFL